jgi:hypothetical protein
MGSSNLNCAISNFPINDGEKVVCIFLVKESRGRSQPYYPWGQWKFGSLPFIVEMGDYSAPNGITDCEGSESGEMDTFNPLDKIIYTNFRKDIYTYKKGKDGIPAPILTKPDDDRDGWFHTMRYGSYDISTGYSHEFNPVLCEKTASLEFGWFNRFDPTDINVMFINLNVYKYMTKPLKKTAYSPKKDVLEEWFEGVDNFILHNNRLQEELRALEKTGHKYETSKKMKAVYEEMDKLGILCLGVDRFEWLSHGPFSSYLNELKLNPMDKTINLGIRKKWRELYNLTYNLWGTQMQFQPSSGMSPQGGWYSGVEKIKKYHEEMIAIYDKRMKQLKNCGF